MSFIWCPESIFGYRHGSDWVLFCSAQALLCSTALGQSWQYTSSSVQPGGGEPRTGTSALTETKNKQRNTEDAVNFDNENGDEASFWEQTEINKEAHAAYLSDFCEGYKSIDSLCRPPELQT